MPTLAELLTWLHARLGDAALLRGGIPDVQTLALALDPTDLPPDLSADAAFLHRAHRLADRLPGLGILASHDGFDAQLTTGANAALAGQLGWTGVARLHWQGRVLGLRATPPQPTWDALRAALEEEFGGLEGTLEPAAPQPPRLALISALRPDILDFLAEQGITVCVTGQLRPAAVPRARELGLGIIALGHRRSELWGLRQLARELEAGFPELHTRVYGEA